MWKSNACRRAGRAACRSLSVAQNRIARTGTRTARSSLLLRHVYPRRNNARNELDKRRPRLHEGFDAVTPEKLLKATRAAEARNGVRSRSGELRSSPFNTIGGLRLIATWLRSAAAIPLCRSWLCARRSTDTNANDRSIRRHCPARVCHNSRNLYEAPALHPVCNAGDLADLGDGALPP